MDPARLASSALACGVVLAAVACGSERPTLILAATTSTYDSGLLEVLIETYEARRPGAAVRTVVAGSGQALELARRGDVDLAVVHAPAAEMRFVEAGHAIARTPK
ncbi:MAG: substrate-binding domain-containing protein, partial [Gemmatimonadetes bacterium]|nr:substrate-binding domain-containing protein [Gemmatimonadota bacterium]